ncbi:MAG TPA: molybdate ABC transporter substrate-binding protein [Acidimicrobiales bacterium]|nr:molybdate ABC transporter substrate-binding protein [Acidimicrobiales bacterium]
MTAWTALAAVPVAAVVAALGTACGEGGDDRPAAGGVRGSITVLAAASLQEPFTELGRRFEARHPGASVRFSFDGSSTVARQVEAGAPADVLATADEASMAPVAGAGLVSAPLVFARNRLAILVARGNPHRIRALADLGRPGLDVVLCAPDVPCGRLAATALERAGAGVRPRSLELNVKGVVAKVTLGEADAGIVFVTDVGAAGRRTEGVEIPEEENAVTGYPLATVRAAPNQEAAARFVELVVSEEGRQVLAGSGFET